MSSNKILKGTAILAVAGILVKVLGAIFKIPLNALIGVEGLAYYSYAYPLYSLLLVVATAGLPVAISRLVSEKIAVNDYTSAQRVFKLSRWLMFGVGLVSFLICFFGAELMAEYVYKDPGAVLPIKAIAPALIFVPIMSSYRGYFQGTQNMNPTAISQFVEQIVRVGVGLLATILLLDMGLDAAAAGATFGAPMGAVGGLIVIALIYKLNGKAIAYHVNHSIKTQTHETNGQIIKQILAIAVPITIGASIAPMMNFADSAIVVRRLLDAGFALGEARDLFGELSGYCTTMIGLPQVITQGIAVSMVPAVAAAFKLKNKVELTDSINMGMRISMIVGMPCAVGMMVLAEPILVFIFGMDEETIAAAIHAAPTLQIMCAGVVLMALLSTTNGILQGIDKQLLPVKNEAISAVLKIVVTYVLVAIPSLNIMGAAIGSVVAYGVAFALNMRDLYKYAQVKVDIGLAFVKPIIASVLMGTAAFAAFKLLLMIIESQTLAMFGSIMVGVITYVVLIFALKAIKKEEIAMLPKGDKLIKIADKFIK
ncbi:MAG: polysaccharide biosynthesis protein [Firmicutes bacterium]|nr:polysaccharide biosynthesis protein [Bacillota bacterium]